MSGGLAGQVLGRWPRTLNAPGGGAGLSFQTEDAYVRPVWAAWPGDQQMMAHLDIEVDDLEAGVAHTVAAGGVLADYQPQEKVRVFLDPAGHPFDLWIREQHRPDPGPGGAGRGC